MTDGNGVNEALLRDYLLGRLAPEARQGVEERLLTEGDFFQQLLMVEDDLVDDYLSGALSERERERFAALFLSTPEGQKKCRFARALRRRVEQENDDPAGAADDGSIPLQPPQGFLASLQNRAALAYIGMAAVAVLVAGGAWLAMQRQGPVTPRSDAGRQVMVVGLSSGLTRDAGEITRVKLSAEVGTVRLEVYTALSGDDRYAAAVQTDLGAEIFKADGLVSGARGPGGALLIDVPARLLAAGDYQLKISELTPDGSLAEAGRYYFRVLRE